MKSFLLLCLVTELVSALHLPHSYAASQIEVRDLPKTSFGHALDFDTREAELSDGYALLDLSPRESLVDKVFNGLLHKRADNKNHEKATAHSPTQDVKQPEHQGIHPYPQRPDSPKFAQTLAPPAQAPNTGEHPPSPQSLATLEAADHLNPGLPAIGVTPPDYPIVSIPAQAQVPEERPPPQRSTGPPPVPISELPTINPKVAIPTQAHLAPEHPPPQRSTGPPPLPISRLPRIEHPDLVDANRRPQMVYQQQPPPAQRKSDDSF